MRIRITDEQTINIKVTTNKNFNIATSVATGDIDGGKPKINVYENELNLTLSPSSGRPNDFLIQCWQRISGSGMNGLRTMHIRRLPITDPNFRKEIFAVNVGGTWGDAVLEVSLSIENDDSLKTFIESSRDYEKESESSGFYSEENQESSNA